MSRAGAGVAAITYTESAGVGDVGFRGLQIGRIDTFEVGGMKIRNIPALIKNPPLGNLPGREPDSSRRWRSACRCASTTAGAS